MKSPVAFSIQDSCLPRHHDFPGQDVGKVLPYHIFEPVQSISEGHYPVIGLLLELPHKLHQAVEQILQLL